MSRILETALNNDVDYLEIDLLNRFNIASILPNLSSSNQAIPQLEETGRTEGYGRDYPEASRAIETHLPPPV